MSKSVQNIVKLMDTNEDITPYGTYKVSLDADGQKKDAEQG